jgi:hypothetical protein
MTDEDEERNPDMNQPIQKCCFKGCNRLGRPDVGFDFFACDECCYELDWRITNRHPYGSH